MIYYNDTGKEVHIHPATVSHGCEVSLEPIQPLEEREFKLPVESYPWVKMWEHNGRLSILVSPRSLDNTGKEALVKEAKAAIDNIKNLREIRDFSSSFLAVGIVLVLISIIGFNFFNTKWLYVSSIMGFVILIVSAFHVVKTFVAEHAERSKINNINSNLKDLSK